MYYMQITNLKINNHRNDVLKLNAILADQHFAPRDQNFHTHTKFTIIEQLQNAKSSRESITELLKNHNIFWLEN